MVEQDLQKTKEYAINNIVVTPFINKLSIVKDRL